MFGIRPMTGAKRAEKIVSKIYIVHEFPNLDCNIYLINSKEVGESESDYELCLIDSGNGLNTQNLFEGIKKLGFDPKKISTIIITHEHLDHILGVFKISSMMNGNCKIYALGETARVIREGDEQTISPVELGVPISLFHTKIVPLEVNEVKEGDIIRFGGVNLKVLHTPGHSLGSMSLYDEQIKILFPGDVIFCGGSFGRVDFPGGSASELKKSINRLNQLDVKYLCPGHMHISRNGNEEIAYSKKMIELYF
ncbi:MAG: MBL fold metallo-hydrolase [Promethearchaeota archaeon]